jgi:hypothetical protein
MVKEKRSIRSTLVWTGMALFAGFYLWMGLDAEREEREKTNSVFVGDFNNDGLADIVNGQGFITLQQKDGSYLSLKEAERQERQQIEKKYDEFRNSADNLVKSYKLGN